MVIHYFVRATSINHHLQIILDSSNTRSSFITKKLQYYQYSFILLSYREYFIEKGVFLLLKTTIFETIILPFFNNRQFVYYKKKT